tara:strand:+ start:17680 stop:17946 length:267 start_codon:yes stop_codon:yes gene_type:complete
MRALGAHATSAKLYKSRLDDRPSPAGKTTPGRRRSSSPGISVRPRAFKESPHAAPGATRPVADPPEPGPEVVIPAAHGEPCLPRAKSQ